MIRGRFEHGEPVVDCVISIPALGIDSPERVKLLVDTGASRSVLQPADVRRIGASPEQISADPRTEEWSGVGGSMRVFVTTTLLTFSEDAARERPYRHSMGIAEPTPSNLTLPSILGMDFIRHFRLTVSVRENRVELEPLFDGAQPP